jgi:carbon-monoxide dehydrogenase small subunit
MIQLEQKGIVSEGPITLFVNGDSYKLGIQPNWTLQYVLHDMLGLIGTKEFCGQGACGACA